MSFDLITRVRGLDPRDVGPRANKPRKPTPPPKKVELWFGNTANGWPEPTPVAPAGESQDRQEARAKRFRAKYHARDDALRRNVSLRAMGMLVEALAHAGAVFEASAEQHRGHRADGGGGPRGPNGEVPSYKLGSNDGWHVTRDECEVLASRLTSSLAGGLEVDPERAGWLGDLAAFFRTAALHHGFEVW